VNTNLEAPERDAVEHPWNAAFLDVIMSTLKPVRQKLVPLARGRVLELGVGTGMNFPFYGEVESLHGIEPDPHMLRRALDRAEKLGLKIEISQAGAEALPYADASFDTVLVTWVLCTIPDPEAALREVARVLKPGGRMLFAEHVKSRYPVARKLQDWVTPAWKKCSGGCHLNRDALAMIRAAGFSDIQIKQCGRDTWTLLPMYRGVAVRAA
jgi:ubiquinone/menaquinone biosynthesis C-methylase UbiE